MTNAAPAPADILAILATVARPADMSLADLVLELDEPALYDVDKMNPADVAAFTAGHEAVSAMFGRPVWPGELEAVVALAQA